MVHRFGPAIVPLYAGRQFQSCAIGGDRWGYVAAPRGTEDRCGIMKITNA